MLCPAETPEGGSVGVVKNLSYLTHVTIPCNSNALYEFIEPQLIPFDNVKSVDFKKKIKVFVNGCWLGLAKNPIELYHDLRNKKSMGILNIYVSIIFDSAMQEIRVCNDAGRLMRPLLKVKNNNLQLTAEHLQGIKSKTLEWEDLLTNARIAPTAIEYIDSAEQNMSLIAMNANELEHAKKFTRN